MAIRFIFTYIFTHLALCICTNALKRYFCDSFSIPVPVLPGSSGSSYRCTLFYIVSPWILNSPVNVSPQHPVIYIPCFPRHLFSTFGFRLWRVYRRNSSVSYQNSTQLVYSSVSPQLSTLPVVAYSTDDHQITKPLMFI